MLTFLALADRPALLLPAAVVLVPVSFLSFAGILLPLLIPAALLLLAYGRRGAAQPLRAVATLVWVLVALVAAGTALLVHADPRSYVTPTEQGGTSDVVTVVEALVSLACTITGVLGAWLIAGDGARANARKAI